MPAKGQKGIKATQQVRDRIVELREGGKPLQLIPGLIAGEYGVTLSQNYVEWICLAEGAVPPHLVGKPVKPYTGSAVYERAGKLVRIFTEAEDNELLRLEGLRLGLREIARRLGRGDSSVRKRLVLLAHHDARAEAAAEAAQVATREAA